MCLVEKLKTNLVIFSIVLAIFSTFFCCKVYANELESKTYNYDNSTNVVSNYDKFSTALEETRVYLEQYKDNYYYFVRFDSMKIYVDLVEKKSSINAYIKLSSSSITYSQGSGTTKLNLLKFDATDLNDFQTKFSTFKTNLENNKFTYDYWSGSSSSAYTSSGVVSGSFLRMYYTNFDNFILSEDSVYNLNLNGDTIIKLGEKIPTYYNYINKKVVDFKKSGSYAYLNDNMGSLKYLDLYFNKEDFQKEIDFSLIFEDYNNYISCGFDCDLASVLGFDIAYLVKDENNIYKWVKNNQIGVSLDIDELPQNNGSGFILNSKILLKFDDTIYTNIEQVKVSINFNSAFNFSYEYYDNSNITAENIDEYYSVMLGQNGRLYRTKQYDKYSILSTLNEKIKENIVIEYVNTDKHLYVEYFDVSNASYIDNGLLSSASNYTFNERQFEKYSFEIGTKNKRGLYLMNYLYHKDDKNENSYYYYYLPLDISLYNTDYLDEALFYDNNNSLISGIISNPDYETDNINFIDNFRPFFQLNEDLEQTRIFFNDAFNVIYSKLPLMIKVVMQLICHILCIAVLLEMLGWGDY